MLSASHGRASRAEPKRTQSLKETWRKPIKTGADTTASLLLSTICLKLNLRIHLGSHRTRAEPMNHREVTASPSHLPARALHKGSGARKATGREHRARSLPGEAGRQKDEYFQIKRQCLLLERWFGFSTLLTQPVFRLILLCL